MLFRLTKNASEQIHEERSAEGVAENRYCEWVVDIVIGEDRKKYFLITNAYSCFSIVVSAKGLTSGEKFSEAAVAELKIYFEHCGLNDLFEKFIMPNISDVRFAKTNNKRVTGVITGFKSNFEIYRRFSKLSFGVADLFNKRPSKVDISLSEEMTLPKEAIKFPSMTEPVQSVVQQTKSSKQSVKKIQKYKNEYGEVLTNPLDIAQDICWTAADIRDDIPEGLIERKRLAKKALSYCPDSTDAYVLLAEDSKNDKEKFEYALKGKLAFEKVYDNKFFEENKGMFWGVLETRPYMRVLWQYSYALKNLGEETKAIECMKYMIELCPEDNIGIRYNLLHLLIKNELFSDAEKLVKEYDDEQSSGFSYGKLLLLLAKKSTDSSKVSNAYKEAIDENRYVPSYLLGKKEVSSSQPDYVCMGSEEEANSYAYEYLCVWEKYPEAIELLESKNNWIIKFPTK